MKKVICCIFPAFGNEYIKKKKDIITQYFKISEDLINSASRLLNINFQDINLTEDNNSFDELSSQYFTYFYSSMLSRILKNHKINLSEYTAGYSMGIYAALYHSESISFEDGINLIKNAYEFILNSLDNQKFCMGTIIGLEYDFLKNIIKNNNLNDVNIINVNNKHSIVISGITEDVASLIEKSKVEGALSAKLLPITAPYHSNFLEKAATNFRNYLEGIKFEKPKFKIISSHDQKILNTIDDIKTELMNNLCTNHNWLNTMNKLLHLKNETFFECGPGKSLFKMAKFIDGEFKLYTIKSLSQLLNNEF